jgi:hypothetical protein
VDKVAIEALISELRTRGQIEGELYRLGALIIRSSAHDNFPYVRDQICGLVVNALAARLDRRVDDTDDRARYDHLFDLLSSVGDVTDYSEGERILRDLLDLINLNIKRH